MTTARGTDRPRQPPAPPISARTTELLLLIFAASVVGIALLLVDAEQNQRIDRSLVYLALAYLSLFLGAHLVVRKTARHADALILPTVALLNGLGLTMIHRLDLGAATLAAEVGQPIPSADAPRQMAWTALAAILLATALWQVRDHRVLARYTYLSGLGALILLGLPGVLPASISRINGAKLWVRIGAFSIQPGEFAKIMMIVFVSAVLVAKRDLFRTAGRRILGVEFPRARDLAPLIVAWSLSVVVLAIERELGASLLIFVVVLTLLYVATARSSWVLVGLAFFAAGAAIAYYAFNHVRDRIQTWVHLNAFYNSSGYQVYQALFGLGTGGIGGTGLGAGRPELVPLAKSDFIAAALGEELGLIGLTAILLLYLILVVRGLKTALKCRDSFGTLVATGISTTIALQVFIVLGGVTDLIPLTGLTTPFLSYGGSSLLANYLAVAMLLRISDTANRPESRPLPRTPLSSATTQYVPRKT